MLRRGIYNFKYEILMNIEYDYTICMALLKYSGERERTD